MSYYLSIKSIILRLLAVISYQYNNNYIFIKNNLNLIPLTYSLENFPIATAIIGLDFKIKEFSRLWSKEFPSSYANDLDNLYLTTIAHIPKEVIEKITAIFKGERDKIENLETKNSQNLWFLWKINPLKDQQNQITGVIIVTENITERKKKEELHIQSEIVAKVGGWEFDLISNTIYWSNTTKAIHELPLSYIPILEEGINFYKAGEYRELISKLINEAINNGSPWDEELQIITAKGKEIWVRAKGEAEINNGKCIRIFGTFQDIDKKKRKDIAYERLTDRLKIATKTANIGIWEFDYEKDHLYWSDEMYTIYGIDADLFEGHTSFWNHSLHPKDKDRCWHEISMALDKKEGYETEFRIVLPDGQIRTIKSVANIELDTTLKVKKLIGANWDITELKDTQLKLAKNEQSFKGAFENSSMGMALIAIDGSWLSVNENISNNLGYTKEELLKLKFQDLTHPDDVQKDLASLKQIFNGNIENYQLEKRYFHKDGSIVYAILTVTAVRDLQGNLVHYISQIMDITSRIKAENKTKKLIGLTGSQNKSLLNFAHIVSHNLRSHSTNLSMLTNFLKEETDLKEKRHLENMLSDASESLTETVHHLNDVVQITTSTKEQLKKVNLLRAVQSVEKNINALLQEKNVLYHFEIPEDIYIKAVPAYLESILLNLFTNSIKYSSPNRRPEINITTKVHKDNLIIDFSDNGQGIDLKRHGGKLFGMYKTFHQHKDAKGIGLFITKNQIEAMNGKIEVKSKVDIGTTFILSFETYNEVSINKTSI